MTETVGPSALMMISDSYAFTEAAPCAASPEARFARRSATAEGLGCCPSPAQLRPWASTTHTPSSGCSATSASRGDRRIGAGSGRDLDRADDGGHARRPDFSGGGQCLIALARHLDPPGDVPDRDRDDERQAENQ